MCLNPLQKQAQNLLQVASCGALLVPMTGLRPARQHTLRLVQLAALAYAGALDPRVQMAVAQLGCADPDFKAEAIEWVLQGFDYLADDGAWLPSALEVVAIGANDCDGLAVLAAALGLAAGLQVVIELYRMPWDHDATHVAARVAGRLVDPTPAPSVPWELTSPGPLVLEPFTSTCCEGCA